MRWAFKSTSIWAAVIVGAASAVRYIKPEWAEAVDAVIGVAAALGLVGLRRSDEKVKRAAVDAINRARQ